MSAQKIVDQISFLLGQLLAGVAGNKQAVTIINNMLIEAGKILDTIDEEK